MKLNIQLFATSGTISGTSTAPNCSTRIVWKETSRDITNKTITLKVSVQIYKSGTGQTMGTFSGSVKIDGASYNISKYFNPYNYSKWAEVGSKTVTIQNASNKNVSLSSSLTQSGTTMAGTYKVSGSAQLDSLFDPPVITDVTMQEINPNLIGIIDHNIFVDNLSIKQFQITSTFDEESTPTRYTILNRIVPYSSTNNIVTLNCIENELEKNEDGTIDIKARVIDSNDGVGYSETIQCPNIPYKNINLIETATYVKRNGQTSGRAFLNVSGTFFNDSVGSVNQSGEYKPNIKYKFWEYGTQEPNSYDNVIPSNNIDHTGNKFTITNLEIGTQTESAINHFNPEKAYRFRIQVNDNFTTYESTEKSITVGEYLWGEFRDRVDFKKITIKGDQVLMPFILFENDSGTSTGTITLNDDVSNYEYIEVYYKPNATVLNTYRGGWGSVKIHKPCNSKKIEMRTDYDNGTYWYYCFSAWTFNDDKLTKNSEVRWRSGTGSTAQTRTDTTSSDSNIFITKIVGYR